MASHAKEDMTLPMWRRLIPVAVLLLGLALFLLLDLERYFSFEMLSHHHATLTSAGSCSACGWAPCCR